jgi:hypothetical protein
VGEEGFDLGGGLRIGEQLLAKGVGEVGFRQGGADGSVADAERGIAEGREMATAAGAGAMGTAGDRRWIGCGLRRCDTRFLELDLGLTPVKIERSCRLLKKHGLGLD